MTFAAILGMRLGIRVYGQKRRDANRHGGDTAGLSLWGKVDTYAHTFLLSCQNVKKGISIASLDTYALFA